MTAFDIGAYGKLPASKEFLRHGCYDGAPLQFKQWLDTGYDYASGREVLPPQGSGVRRWLYSNPGDRDLIVATTIDSKDASGTRRFPFALFVTVPRTSLGSVASLARVEPLWQALEERLAQVRSITTSEVFYETVRGSHVDATLLSEPEALVVAESFRELPLQKWVDGLYSMDPVDLWVRGLWRLRAWTKHVMASPGTPQLRAVRVPVSPSSSYSLQVDVWLEVLRRLHPVFEPMPCVWMPPLAEKSGAVDLVYRVPTPDDFAASLGANLPDGTVSDLADGKGKLPIDGFGDFRRRLEARPLLPESPVRYLLSFDLME